MVKNIYICSFVHTITFLKGHGGKKGQILVLAINSSDLPANEETDTCFHPMAFPQEIIASWSNVHACFVPPVAHVFDPRA